MNEIDTQRKLMLHALNQKDYDAAVYHREKLEEAQEANRSRKTNKPKVVEVKRKKAVLSQSDWETIERAYLDGVKAKTLAEIYGIHKETIRAKMRKRGHRTIPNKEDLKKRNAEIMQKLANGATNVELAVEYNLSKATIKRIKRSVVSARGSEEVSTGRRFQKTQEVAKRSVDGDY